MTSNDHQSDAQRILEVEFQGRKVEVPYWPQPGHPDNAITLFLGYDQKKAGRVGTGTGYNAYKVRPSGAQYTGAGAKITVTKQILGPRRDPGPLQHGRSRAGEGGDPGRVPQEQELRP